MRMGHERDTAFRLFSRTSGISESEEAVQASKTHFTIVSRAKTCIDARSAMIVTVDARASINAHVRTASPKDQGNGETPAK